jgi:hypothetical protein
MMVFTYHYTLTYSADPVRSWNPGGRRNVEGPWVQCLIGKKPKGSWRLELSR